MVDISGMERSQVLAALYNASRPQGAGFMRYTPDPITIEQAAEMLQRTSDFDYIAGRVMKINLTGGDELETRWYNRDNGEGAAEIVINSVRASGDVNNQLIQRIHEMGANSALALVRKELEKDSTFEGNTLTLGLADLRQYLEPKVDTAERHLRDQELTR